MNNLEAAVEIEGVVLRRIGRKIFSWSPVHCGAPESAKTEGSFSRLEPVDSGQGKSPGVSRHAVSYVPGPQVC